METDNTTAASGWLNPDFIDSDLACHIHSTTARVHRLAEEFYALAVSDIRPVVENWTMFLSAQDIPEAIVEALDEASGYQALSRLLTNLHQFVEAVEGRIDGQPALQGMRRILDGTETQSLMQVVEGPLVVPADMTDEGSFYGD